MNKWPNRLALGLAALWLLPALPAVADDDPYPTLQAEWWQWAFSLPRSHNPIFDNTGAYCGYGQRGDIWFLAGNSGGKTVRSCTVPAGVRLFIPVINVACTFEPVAPFDDLSDCLADTVDFVKGQGPYAGEGFSGLSVTLDGVVDHTPHFGASAPFAAVVPRNGIFGYAQGVVPGADVGWYFLSDALAAGSEHTLRVTGAGYGFSLDVTYRIRVVDGTYPD